MGNKTTPIAQRIRKFQRFGRQRRRDGSMLVQTPSP